MDEGEYAVAERDLRDALALRTALGPAHAPEQIATWQHLGSLLVGRGRIDEATRAFETADRIAEDVGLPDSLTLDGGMRRGHGRMLRGIAETDAGRLEQAQQSLEQATREIGSAYGPDSVPMSRVHMAWSKLALRRGRLDEVLAHAEAADANVRRWLGDDHGLRMHALSAIGTVAFHQGRIVDAVAAFEEALRLAEATLPEHSMALADQRSNLGEALVLAGEGLRARPLLERALESMRRSLDERDPSLAYPLHGLAEAAWQAGEFEEAHRRARQALSLREDDRADPAERARTRWLLARIEAERGDAARAEQLAEDARAGFEGLGPAFAATVEEIDAWTRETFETSG